ncbi:aminoglycoside adenylyltransferase domain-containing protein [Nocardioides sp.]|uniref:aminoglycoside adenylyltransferase domain-containing protein n=1 Tax=Nocardioides sp. TaxID=35761 RepID=UPI002BB09BEB|nr:aminoglycoside adenylyltransferase domain-containing protein [Nocardioides sp.]HSX69185.1 aminoglycoside adenylyltransferase domain-containing protein [Nocardioides sp.]
MTSHALPKQVVEVCTTWLDLVDGLAPGLVTGLHVRGGVGFGEFVPGVSDIDMVAVLAHRRSYAEVDALAESHALLGERGLAAPLDGVHVTASDLARDPDDCPDVPCVLHGWFEAEGRYDVSPVGWHELAFHSVPVRGDLPAVWTDHDRLLAFTRNALATEWAAHASSLAKFPDEAATDAATWHVLGAARLLHLVQTGRQTSKSAAGRWALATLDEQWHPVLHDALRLRDGLPGTSPYADPADRGADVAAFVAHVVASA